MNPSQKKYLRERLQKAKWNHDRVRPKTPAAVLRAGKIVLAWNKQQSALDEKARQKVEARYKRAQEILLFGTADEALAAVKAFEAGR